jgi:hypothetical protein
METDYQLLPRSEKDVVMTGTRAVLWKILKKVVDKSNLSPFPVGQIWLKKGTLLLKGTGIPETVC